MATTTRGTFEAGKETAEVAELGAHPGVVGLLDALYVRARVCRTLDSKNATSNKSLLRVYLWEMDHHGVDDCDGWYSRAPGKTMRTSLTIIGLYARQTPAGASRKPQRTVTGALSKHRPPSGWRHTLEPTHSD